MNKLIQKIVIGISTVVIALSSFAMPAAAAPLPLGVQPFEYVSALGDCGVDYPAGTAGNVTAKWDTTTGNRSPSLLLEKLAATTDCSSAGATITGIEGIVLSELNFDIKNGDLCTGGSPRFNVSASDGFHFIGGCGNGTQTTPDAGWTHVVFDPTNPAQAFPPITAGATINSIELILDEQGTAHVDNISVNDAVVGRPKVPTSKDQCKKNGYKDLEDANGMPFKNQGQCVSYFNHL